MFLKHKRPAEKAEADRQLIIDYKKAFGSEEGKRIFSDLANRFFLLNPITGNELERAEREGMRKVMLHILTQREVDLAQFERLLKGEL